MENTLLPQEFIEKVSQILPSHLDLQQFIESCHTPLRKSVRCNSLKMDEPALNEMATRLDWQLDNIPWCDDGKWLKHNANYPLGNIAEHLAGHFYIQEASSMLPPAALMALAPDATNVLDMAAAPGSKTTQLAAAMNNQGLLVANELSSSRIRWLFSNIQRCGIQNSVLTHFDGQIFGRFLPGFFDAILLDAPCSGEGTVRKDPDAFKNWDHASVLSLADLQKKLIESAYLALKPGGVLVYSTCTLNHEENQEVCQHLIDSFPKQVSVARLDTLFTGAERVATPEGYLHIWPQIFDSEGFFVAAFRKAEHAPLTEPESLQLRRFPFAPASRKAEQEITTHLHRLFQWEKPDNMDFYSRDAELWLFPNEISQLAGKIKLDRIGVKVADKVKNGFKLTHAFATTYGNSCKQRIQPLTKAQAESYLMGRDVYDIEGLPKKGEFIVTYQGMVLGLTKVTNQRLKNQLPRELVRDSRITL